MEHTDILAVISRLTFTFAKTMPDEPHEYTIRGKGGTEADFQALFDAIRAHGKPGDYRGQRFRYFEPGDGWKYWLIGYRWIINRARVEPPA